MQHADEASLSVVVLEAGSGLPLWLTEYRKHAPNSIVVAQSAQESGADFARRVARRAGEIGAGDAAIHAALLICNGALDDASVSARDRVCASLLTIMVAKRQGELVLATESSAAADLRHELLALAGRLCHRLRGSPVGVRVRFGNASQGVAASGVIKTAPPAAELTANEDRMAARGRD
jgi:hypothetical protein